jgi:NAD-dependent dihydropyrimidine dehydrogenase PreA subunit
MKTDSGEKVYVYPNAPAPYRPVIFDPLICNGCNECLACQMDVLYPNEEEGRPPIIMFPDECWYCGSCVDLCPRPGAARMNHPLMQRTIWRDKSTGELFRL